MSTHNATLSSGCSKASWRVTANSPHWGLNPGPSVYKTDALPLSYRGFRFDDKLVRPTIYCRDANSKTNPLPSPQSRITRYARSSEPRQQLNLVVPPILESPTLKRKRHTRSNTSKHTHTHVRTQTYTAQSKRGPVDHATREMVRTSTRASWRGWSVLRAAQIAMGSQCKGAPV